MRCSYDDGDNGGGEREGKGRGRTENDRFVCSFLDCCVVSNPLNTPFEFIVTLAPILYFMSRFFFQCMGGGNMTNERTSGYAWKVPKSSVGIPIFDSKSIPSVAPIVNEERYHFIRSLL